MLYLDTETMGLSPEQGAELVEIAVIDDAGTVLFDSLVNPGRPIPPVLTTLHGITDAMVVDAMPADEARRLVLDLVRGHELVIYNAPFDIVFFPGIENAAAAIHCCMRRFSDEWPGRTWSEEQGGWKRQKLTVAAAHCGHQWAGTGPHRALADARACRTVWQWCEHQAVESAAV